MRDPCPVMPLDCSTLTPATRPLSTWLMVVTGAVCARGRRVDIADSVPQLAFQLLARRGDDDALERVRRRFEATSRAWRIASPARVTLCGVGTGVSRRAPCAADTSPGLSRSVYAPCSVDTAETEVPTTCTRTPLSGWPVASSVILPAIVPCCAATGAARTTHSPAVIQQ